MKERETHRQRTNEGVAEREGQRIRSGFHADNRQPDFEARTHQPRDHDQSQSRTINWLSHPGTPRCAVLTGHMHPMFIAALSTIAKVWKEPRCPSTDEWIKKMWYIYTIEYYSTIKKNEILPFATMWIELDCIMLGEIGQSQKDKYRMISLTYVI